ncbi:MAG TPA: hypothetical protein VMD92_14515 [Acidobacteriaceae bacterium]|nr:hypothetical protein [Acidobacteriaceae bacterium]
MSTRPATPSLNPRFSRAKCYTLYAALSVLILFIHGYHPFASDAGLYVAGIRRTLDPSLYPVNAAFVAVFTHHSIFAVVLASLVRLTHLPLAWILLIAHLASLWLFLCACGALAARLFASEFAGSCAALLAAACCTLPVAGTALVLMDPYVTARSFSTPLGLFAVATCLDRAWLRTAILLLCAALVHPLMGAYAAAFVAVLALIACGRARDAVLLCCAAGIMAAVVCEVTRNAPVSAAYREAVLLPQRSFLFLARWHWYELLGLVLPLLLFGSATQKYAASTHTGAVCRSSVAIGVTSILIAALFVSPSGPYQLVPLQVLRSFHIIYLVGVVLCGGILASIATLSRYAAAALLLLIAGFMFQVEHASWPGGDRIEWPNYPPANLYEQAFLWIRGNTPRDAVFAFDPQTVYNPRETEQGFRALAERDHLADDKDAGVVAVVPSLAGRWALQRNSQFFVDSMTDAQRFAALAPLGATWLLLPPTAQTSLPCPFHNGAVQVCRLVPPLAPTPRPKANGPGLLT